MKRKLLVLFLFFSFCLAAQSHSDVKWGYDYSKILKKANRNKKPVVVYFSGSDWCAPCKRLKKDLFEASSFENLAKKCNLLYVDIPQNRDLISEAQYKHNKELMNKLNPRKVFPMVMILDKKGNIKKQLSGYGSIQEPSNYLHMIRESIK